MKEIFLKTTFNFTGIMKCSGDLTDCETQELVFKGTPTYEAKVYYLSILITTFYYFTISGVQVLPGTPV